MGRGCCGWGGPVVMGRDCCDGGGTVEMGEGLL